jgi:glycerol-3-phosphate dehydrogenase
MPFPVRADFVDGRHADNNIAGLRAPFMRRDLNALTARTFDVLVVGGGIYGLTIAYDAAQRGLSVALIERNDFGSGASFNHLRTIHGGLRYLQTLDLARARESVKERRTLAQIAPDAVRPMPFVLPLSSSLTQGRLAMRAGFLLDRVISRHKNDDLPASHRLPGGRVLDRSAALARFPILSHSNLTGAALWYDYVATQADRLTLAWGLAASAYGAVLANYVEARRITIEGGRAIGVHAADRQTKRTLEISARITVNATGGAADRLLSASGVALGSPVLKAMNLVTTRDAPDFALGGRGMSGRTLFMVPWRKRALFGTWESPEPCAPDDLSVSKSDVTAFIAEVNHAFPSLAVTTGDVTLVHRGVVPAVVHADGRATLQGHEQVRDHADRGVEGLVSVAGTKYTTARAVAERVTNRLCAKLGRSDLPCRTADDLLPFTTATDDALLTLAARDEMVVTLEDAVVRRTPLGALGYPGDQAVDHAAIVVGEALGWDQATRRNEIEGVRRFYGTSNAWNT